MKKLCICLVFAILIVLNGALAAAQSRLFLIGNYEYSIPDTWISEKSADGYYYHYETGDAHTGAYMVSGFSDLGMGLIDLSTLTSASEIIFESVFDGYAEAMGISKLEYIDVEINSGFDQFPYEFVKGSPEAASIESTVYMIAWVDFDNLYMMMYTNSMAQNDEALHMFQEIVDSTAYAGESSNSRKNPGEIGEKQRIIVKKSGSECTMQVTVDEFYRGEDYIALVGDGAKHTDDEHEYVAVKVTAEFIRINNAVGNADPEIVVDEIFDFKSYNSSGAKYDNVHYAIPGMKELTSVYEGASTTGYFQFEIEKSDPAPMLVYEPEYDKKLWFSLD